MKHAPRRRVPGAPGLLDPIRKRPGLSMVGMGIYFRRKRWI
jgi:hypothetical protein